MVITLEFFVDRTFSASISSFLVQRKLINTFLFHLVTVDKWGLTRPVARFSVLVGKIYF